jgi:hypothetical protein
MNVEDFRNFCLSLPDSSEKMPFQAFKAAQSILAFYVGGKIFCYFDIEKFDSCTKNVLIAGNKRITGKDFADI